MNVDLLYKLTLQFVNKEINSRLISCFLLHSYRLIFIKLSINFRMRNAFLCVKIYKFYRLDSMDRFVVFGHLHRHNTFVN